MRSLSQQELRALAGRLEARAESKISTSEPEQASDLRLAAKVIREMADTSRPVTA